MQAVNGNNTFLVGCVLAGTAQVAPCQYYAVASVVVEAGPLGKDWKLFNITNNKCALQPTQFKLVARLGAELLKTLKDQVATLALEKFGKFWEQTSKNSRDPERDKRQPKKTEVMNVTSKGGKLNVQSVFVGAGFSCLECKESFDSQARLKKHALKHIIVIDKSDDKPARHALSSLRFQIFFARRKGSAKNKQCTNCLQLFTPHGFPQHVRFCRGQP